MQQDPLPNSGLGHYGNVLWLYKGAGTLLYEDVQARCRFEAGQVSTGNIVLLCEFEGVSPELVIKLMDSEPPLKLKGLTEDRQIVRATGNVRCIPTVPPSSSCTAFHANELSVESPSEGEPGEIRFGLTNFQFVGTRMLADTQPGLPVPTGELGLEEEALVVRVRDYDGTMARLRAVGGAGVTAEVVIPAAQILPPKALQQWAADLCSVLSVARGTRIQWVYRETRASDGEVLHRLHASRITKPYSARPPIDPRDSGRVATQDFVQRALTGYRERRERFQLDSGLIDNYLDARLEADFLELRGLKMAVAIEALKSVMLSHPGARTSEYILPTTEFDELLEPAREAIQRILQGAGVAKRHVKALTSKGKIRGLNRRGFGAILPGLLKTIGLAIGEPELQLFMQSRNKLVHSGRFYCQAATEEERLRVPPLRTVTEEFNFLVNFLDRIYLKMMGYSGAYIDWRQNPPDRSNLP